MRNFGGKVYFIDRDNINTDEIIPAKYLTLIEKEPLKPHLLEDLNIEGVDPKKISWEHFGTVISRANFGCGSSREAAVWAFEVNGINAIIASNFARIFRENAFNSGLLAISLDETVIEDIFATYSKLENVFIEIGIDSMILKISDDSQSNTYPFTLNALEKDLVISGGWVALAQDNY